MKFCHEGFGINLSKVMREISRNEVLKDTYECMIGCYGVLDLYDEVKRFDKDVKDFYDNENVIILVPSMEKYLKLVELIPSFLVDKEEELQEWKHIIFIVGNCSKIVNYIVGVEL